MVKNVCGQFGQDALNVFLEISQNSQEKTCARDPFLK